MTSASPAFGWSVTAAAQPNSYVTIGHLNTAQRVAPPPTLTPTGGGVLRQPGATTAAVNTAIAASGPGDVVEVSAGSYASLTMATSGTAAAPITLKALAGAILASGQITITGSYIQIVGLAVTSVAADAIFITGSARDIRINGCTFTGGSGDGASSFGLIKITAATGWAGYDDGFGKITVNGAPPAITRNVTIDQNTFNQPANALVWVNHGNRGVKFTHNNVIGPNGIVSGEYEAVKFGYGVGEYENSASYVAFNTFNGWSPRSPYVMGLKMSGVDVICNHFTVGRLEIRHANNCRIVGNVIDDGDIHGGGSGHTITNNWVKVINADGGHGPFMAYITEGFSPYVGSGGVPWFRNGLTSSTIADNQFWNSGNGFYTLAEFADYATSSPNPTTEWARNNAFSGNRLVGNNTTPVIDSSKEGDPPSNFIAGNTWSANVQSASTTPANVLGGTNTVSDSDVDVPPAAPTQVYLTPSQWAPL